MMRHFVILSAFLLGVLGAPQDELTSGSRIVNGTNAHPGQYPFIASLQYRGRHMCGSSIVNECYVLTASHCVDGDVPSDLSVLVGTVQLSSGGTSHPVSQITMHEGYNPANMYINDIAVLKLSSPLRFNNEVQPVNLPRQLESTHGGTPATVIGWGYPYTGGSVMNHLQHVNINVYSDADCRAAHLYTVHDSNICAGVPQGGKGQCSGDSGGPLIANGHQVGIVSWSMKPCTIAPYPGVYAEVAHYIDWIRRHTNGHC